MTDMILLPAFCFTLLFLAMKALLLGLATAAKRGLSGKFLNSEDAEWLGGEHVDPDPPGTARLGRAHRNDLENLLLFAISGAIYVVAGASAMAGFFYCALFVSARVLHTAAYLGRRPLLRRNAYTLGFVVIAAMIVHAAVVLALSFKW